MNRGIIFACVVLFVAGIVGISYAAGTGPIEPLGAMKSALSVEYNGVYDRDLGKSGAIAKGEIKESTQAYVEYALGLTDMINIYGKLGTANLEQKVIWDSTAGSRNQTLTYDYGILWGIGGNGLYDLGNKFGIGGDVEFNMWFTDVDSITAANATSFSSAGALTNSEFQAALYATYTHEIGSLKLVPYVGGFYSNFKAALDKDIKYSDANYNYTLGDTEGDDNFGILAGVDISLTKSIAVKVEGRFIAETAATAGLSYKF